MATWVYVTKLREPSYSGAGDGIYLAMKFAVYVDMANTSTQAYVRLTNCDLFARTSAAITSRVSASGSIQINGSGTAYSFSTGSSVSQYDLTEYKIPEGGGPPWGTRFSSSTNIPINNTKTEFYFRMTINMRNGESYTANFPACGVVPIVISGPTSVNTGSISTYTISRAVNNNADESHHYSYAAWMAYGRNSNAYSPTDSTYYMYRADACLSQYVMAREDSSNATTFKFVPWQYSGGYGSQGAVCLDYYYIPSGTRNLSLEHAGDIRSYSILDTPCADSSMFYYSTKFGICISSARLSITVNNRSTVDNGLQPVFRRFDHVACAPPGSNVYTEYQNIYDTMISRYGGIAQGCLHGSITAVFYKSSYEKYYYRRPSGEALQYCSYFVRGTLTDTHSSPTKVINLDAALEPGTASWLTYAEAGCSITSFDAAGANRSVTFSLKDNLGFTTTVTDYVTVFPYHRPNMPVCKATRCRVATSGDTELYTYNGVTYTPDENGIYALLQWTVDISPLNNGNSRTLKMRMKPTDSWTTITLRSYSDSNYMVIGVGEDSSYDIQFSISDDFYTNIIFIAPLNTIYAMLDFKHGGTGVAMGKVSELDNVLDIHRNWTLHMPYGTYIQNYYQNGNAVNLYDWMNTVNQRITNIINSRDVPVFKRYAASGTSRWVTTNSSVCVPSGYGSIVEEDRVVVGYSSSTEIRTAGWMNNNGITVNRPYLNIVLGAVYSYSGNTSTQRIVYRPTIYILTSKPTSINQSTGVPNGTIIAQKTFQINSPDFEGLEDIYGNPNTGMYIWNSRHNGGSISYNYYFDLSSYQNTNIWVVVTATCGYCPGLSWRMSEGYVNVEELTLSNSHI